MNVCVRVHALANREKVGGVNREEMGADKEGCRRENGHRRLEDGQGEYERKGTTTWFHHLLSHSWQRHALVTDRQITLL